MTKTEALLASVFAIHIRFTFSQLPILRARTMSAIPPKASPSKASEPGSGTRATENCVLASDWKMKFGPLNPFTAPSVPNAWKDPLLHVVVPLVELVVPLLLKQYDGFCWLYGSINDVLVRDVVIVAPGAREGK